MLFWGDYILLIFYYPFIILVGKFTVSSHHQGAPSMFLVLVWETGVPGIGYHTWICCSETCDSGLINNHQTDLEPEGCRIRKR